LNDIRALCSKAEGTEAIREGETLDGIWSQLREHTDPSAAGVGLLKLAVPPARSASALTTAFRLAREQDLNPSTQAHAGSGVVYLKLAPTSWDIAGIGRLAALVAGLRAYARGQGGSLVLEAGPPAAKHRSDGIDPWGEVGSGFQVMRALKENLDPKGTLNPGRFVGRL
jgi:glycolate oxidase FAD binding subunit